MMSSFLLRASPLAHALGAVRHMGFRTHWWQPVLPALASKVAADLPGRPSTRRKKMQQRKQQTIAMHARRTEGARRNRVIQELKDQANRAKTMDVYRQYAEILRRDHEAAAQSKSDQPTE